MANTIEMRPNGMVEKISTYIVRTTMDERFNKMRHHAFYLSGAPGVGKSASVQTIKEKVEEATGKRVDVTDVRLMLQNPVDLRGIPVADETKTVAKWLRPQIFDMDPAENVINILFLDELSAAPPSVQAASYQILLDHKVGEHELPKNCYVIAAGNRVTDKSVAYKLPKAAANRMTHFDIVPDLDDWKIWAFKHNINSKIIGFLNFKPGSLNSFDPSKDENAFPTPRAWETVNDFIEIYGGIAEAFDCIAGTVGLATAGEFKRYCEVYTKIPNVDDIFNGKEVEMPKGPDVLYALSSAISAKSRNIAKPTAANKQKMENVLRFTLKMPREFAVSTIKDMLLVDGVKTVMITSPAWREWSSTMRSLII